LILIDYKIFIFHLPLILTASANLITMSCQTSCSGQEKAASCGNEHPTQYKFKLVYFDGRGLGEGPRLALALCGAEFEDVRLSDEQFKSQKDSFPFKQAPVLYVNDQPIPQSNAIERFVLNHFGHTYKCGLTQARADAFAEAVRDIAFAYQKTKINDEEKKKFYTEVVPNSLKLLEEYSLKHGKGWAVGDKPTIADVKLYYIYERADKKILDEHLGKSYPHLAGLVRKFEQHPNIAKYLAKRPASEW